MQLFLLMSHDELIKELVLLSEVQENIEQLVIYNPDLQRTIEKIGQDRKRIKRYLFFRYQKHKKLDLDKLEINGNELQTRMRRYLD
jgi:uncharacterized FlaG/YvyC family protein